MLPIKFGGQIVQLCPTIVSEGLMNTLQRTSG